MASHSSEPDFRAVLSIWVDRHAAIVLVATAAAVTVRSAVPVVIAAAASIAAAVHGMRTELRALQSFGGWANRITAIRFGILVAVGAAMARVPQAVIFTAFTLNVLLDVVDGHLARRYRSESPFGAVFDRETDACYVLLAYLYFFLVHGIGAWIILPGLLPYAWRLLTLRFGASLQRDAKARFAAVLAGVNYVMLIAAVASPEPFRTPILVVSASIVFASFGAFSIRFFSHEHSVS